MIKLYADTIISYEEKGIYGYELNIKRFIKNLNTIYVPKAVNSIMITALNSPDFIWSYATFGQFIIYYQFNAKTMQGKMVFFDPYNNMDNALDLWNVFSKENWTKTSKEDFMKMFLTIQEKYQDVDGTVALTTDPVP